MQRQKEQLEKKMEREWGMVVTVPELPVLILELVREHGRIAISEIVRVSGVSRNTVKDHLKSLVEQGHLQLHGAGHGMIASEFVAHPEQRAKDGGAIIADRQQAYQP